MRLTYATARSHVNTEYLFELVGGRIIGRNTMISDAESDEEILTFNASDDALERAARVEEKAFTVVYCTRALYSDCGWPTVENG